MSAPTEQPPRKLSGTRTARLDDLERDATRTACASTEGDIRAAPDNGVRGLSSQVPRQMGTHWSAAAGLVLSLFAEALVAHIAVIGAGITGITTAYSLLDHAHTVTVLDRHRYAAMETSFANGGQLSASNAEVWNHPATLIKGIKWLFRSDAPLLLNLQPSWHKYSGWPRS